MNQSLDQWSRGIFTNQTAPTKTSPYARDNFRKTSRDSFTSKKFALSGKRSPSNLLYSNDSVKKKFTKTDASETYARVMSNVNKLPGKLSRQPIVVVDPEGRPVPSFVAKNVIVNHKSLSQSRMPLRQSSRDPSIRVGQMSRGNSRSPRKDYRPGNRSDQSETSPSVMDPKVLVADGNFFTSRRIVELQDELDREQNHSKNKPNQNPRMPMRTSSDAYSLLSKQDQVDTDVDYSGTMQYTQVETSTGPCQEDTQRMQAPVRANAGLERTQEIVVPPQRRQSDHTLSIKTDLTTVKSRMLPSIMVTKPPSYYHQTQEPSNMRGF